MLIHPYDSALSETEWRDWLASSGFFGVLAVAAEDPNAAPVLVPTHFTPVGNQIVMHLARPNSALKLLEKASECALIVTGDFAYIPNQWRAKPDVPKEDGVPTSYYVAINFICKPTLAASAQETAEIVETQMKHMQPEGGYAKISAEAAPFGPMMNSIRGVYLDILRVEAKFKFDDHKSLEFREHIENELDARNQGGDKKVAAQQRRRRAEIGEWKNYKS